MVMQHFAQCPLCTKAFEIVEESPVIMMDGRVRRICAGCTPRMVAIPVPPVAKPNGGPVNGAEA